MNSTTMYIPTHHDNTVNDETRRRIRAIPIAVVYQALCDLSDRYPAKDLMYNNPNIADITFLICHKICSSHDHKHPDLMRQLSLVLAPIRTNIQHTPRDFEFPFECRASKYFEDDNLEEFIADAQKESIKPEGSIHPVLRHGAIRCFNYLLSHTPRNYFQFTMYHLREAVLGGNLTMIQYVWTCMKRRHMNRAKGSSSDQPDQPDQPEYIWYPSMLAETYTQVARRQDHDSYKVDQWIQSELKLLHCSNWLSRADAFSHSIIADTQWRIYNYGNVPMDTMSPFELNHRWGAELIQPNEYFPEVIQNNAISLKLTLTDDGIDIHRNEPTYVPFEDYHIDYDSAFDKWCEENLDPLHVTTEQILSEISEAVSERVFNMNSEEALGAV